MFVSLASVLSVFVSLTSVLCSSVWPLSFLCLSIWPLSCLCLSIWPLSCLCLSVWPLSCLCSSIWPLSCLCLSIWPLSCLFANLTDYARQHSSTGQQERQEIQITQRTRAAHRETSGHNCGNIFGHQQWCMEATITLWNKVIWNRLMFRCSHALRGIIHYGSVLWSSGC